MAFFFTCGAEIADIIIFAYYLFNKSLMCWECQVVAYSRFHVEQKKVL